MSSLSVQSPKNEIRIQRWHQKYPLLKQHSPTSITWQDEKSDSLETGPSTSKVKKDKRPLKPSLKKYNSDSSTFSNLSTNSFHSNVSTKSVNKSGKILHCNWFRDNEFTCHNCNKDVNKGNRCYVLPCGYVFHEKCYQVSDFYKSGSHRIFNRWIEMNKLKKDLVKLEEKRLNTIRKYGKLYPIDENLFKNKFKDINSEIIKLENKLENKKIMYFPPCGCYL